MGDFDDREAEWATVGGLRYRVVESVAQSRFGAWLTSASVLRHFRHVPSLPGSLHRADPPLGRRPLAVPPVPARLTGTAGIVRQPDIEAEAYVTQGPLPLWHQLHHEGAVFLRRHMWPSIIVVAPRLMRAYRRINVQTSISKSVATRDPATLSARVKARGGELGLSAVGVAEYDHKFTFAPFAAEPLGTRVIVCVLEQNWAATQTAPSSRAERAALAAYARAMELAANLADYIRSLGYIAKANEPTGRALAIHYAVQAGLGQLGLNGQLLTPFAGSRCRILLIDTDAPLALDKPVDFGIPAVCDACKACVRRCPSGAIPAQRKLYRGVQKVKIKTERCLPMVALADGCAVCMKVCPVQRYGLPAVLEEFTRSGQVLGRGTNELEGYDWPLDGRHYGPGDKPRDAVSSERLRPQGLVFDPHRKVPLVASNVGSLGMDVNL